jgi:hypothetical protein
MLGVFKWFSMCTGESRFTRFPYPRFCISAYLFPYHEDHQTLIGGHDRSCRAGPLSCARSFTDSSQYFDSGHYKLRPLMVDHSENTRTFVRFPFNALFIHAAIRRNAKPAFYEIHLYLPEGEVDHSQFYLVSKLMHRYFLPYPF